MRMLITTIPSEPVMSHDVLVVGAGFAGSVCARRIAEDHGLRVLVVDRRLHVAGAAHDALDQSGVLRHSYGAHVLHTRQATSSSTTCRGSPAGAGMPITPPRSPTAS